MNENLLDDIQRQMREMTGGLPAAAPAPSFQSTGPPVASQAFERATTRSLTLRVRALPKLNFALLHAGLPLISHLELTNADRKPANDLLIKAWVAPDYGEAWQTTVADIQPRAVHVEENIVVPLTKSRLQEVREAERGSLRIDVTSEGALVQSQTLPIEVLAYNEWYFHSEIPQIAACFVQPNSPAVEQIVSLVRDRLKRKGGDPSLAGYQQGGAARVSELATALYDTLQQDARISYITPPPSFERPQMLEDGNVTISQKVFFPEQILAHRRGTCLDLALLGASCVERMGLHPILFVVRGHAFFGVWLEPSVLPEPWTRDIDRVRALIADGKWLPFNSTTFTLTAARPFEACRDEALACLQQDGVLLAAVDIMAARRTGMKPVPPLVSVP